MNLIGYSFISVLSLSLFSLAGTVYFRGGQLRGRISFTLFTLSVLCWILFNYFEDENFSSVIRYFFLKGDFLFGVFSILFLFIFGIDYALFDARWKNAIRAGFSILALLFIPLILFTPYILSGYEFSGMDTITPLMGPAGFLYYAFIMILSACSIGIIIFGYLRSDAENRTGYLYLLVGIVLGVVTSVLTNVIFVDLIANSPRYEFYSRLGPFSAAFVVFFPAYAILRHRLFNIRVFSVELLSFAILLVLFFQIFFSDTFILLLVRSITFLVAAILFGILIRSVEFEIKRKEELQVIANRLAIANEEFRKLDNTKSEFISIASHQLRTPLTAIKGFLSLLLEGSYGKLTSEVEEALNKIYSANARLVDLVENLLNISRIESGRIQYQFEQVSLENILRELNETFMVASKSQGLTLSFEYPEKPVKPFFMDASKIREVVSNLIDNALKYTEKGGVTVRLEGNGAVARVIVSDTGVGIISEDLPNLFQKFRRGKNSAKINVSGTGLGLYVGKSFAEAHNGRLFAESDGAGKGARFILELPIRTEEGFVNSRKS